MPQNSTLSFSKVQKTKLIALAFFVEAFYLLLAFVPAAALASVSAMVYGPERGLLVGLMLLALVAWFIRPDPHDHRNDVQIEPASGLHQAVHLLSSNLDAPPIQGIVLNDDLNASAYASQGFLSLYGVRRKLTVGIPLLRLLNADELKAVIAHELGHFSRQHDRLGQWIYQVQYKWGTYLLIRRTENDGFLESAQKLVAHRLIPYFLRESSAWSHQCEYEADAQAHNLGLSKHLIAALTKMEVHGYLWQNQLRQEIVQWQLQSETPPHDALQKISRMVQQRACDSLEPALAYARQHPRRLYDTHPRLHERARAMQVEPMLPANEGPCAGEVFFPDTWQAISQAHQSRWTARHQNAWRFAHFRLKWLATQVQLDRNDMELRAIAGAALSLSSESLDLLRTAVAEHPSNAYLHYELGRCLLAANDEAGLKHLQEAIKLNKKMAVASLQLIHEHHAERDSVTLIGRSLNRLVAAHQWTNSFCGDDLWARLCTEPLEALPETGRKLFASAMENDARIDGCWVGSLQSKVTDGYQFKIHLIVFRLDGSDIHEPDKSEDHVQAQMASLLQVLTRPDELIRVKSVFFGEPLNPNLLDNLERHAGVCIAKPKRAFNQNLIKVDSV
jgi:Zn-dependent protease with chaperone function